MQIPTTLFVAWADFGAIGQGIHADASSIFDDAVDEYSAARSNGLDAIVWRLDTPQPDRAGMMTDVTADADDCIRRRCAARRGELPEWLFDVHGMAAE